MRRRLISFGLIVLLLFSGCTAQYGQKEERKNTFTDLTKEIVLFKSENGSSQQTRDLSLNEEQFPVAEEWTVWTQTENSEGIYYIVSNGNGLSKPDVLRCELRKRTETADSLLLSLERGSYSDLQVWGKRFLWSQRIGTGAETVVLWETGSAVPEIVFENGYGYEFSCNGTMLAWYSVENQTPQLNLYNLQLGETEVIAPVTGQSVRNDAPVFFEEILPYGQRRTENGESGYVIVLYDTVQKLAADTISVPDHAAPMGVQCSDSFVIWYTRPWEKHNTDFFWLCIYDRENEAFYRVDLQVALFEQFESIPSFSSELKENVLWLHLGDCGTFELNLSR